MYAVSNLVPTQNVDALLKKFASLGRRSKKLELPNPLKVTVNRDQMLEVGRDKITRDPVFRSFTWVSVVGETPKLDGYELIARFDSEKTADGERIIYAQAAGDKAIPERYQNLKKLVCEHCNTRRYRKNVFLVQHESGEYKIVARNCLKDYMGHLAPEQMVHWFKMIRTIDHLNEADELTETLQYDDLYYSLVSDLTWVASIVEKKGWLGVGKWNEDNPVDPLSSQNVISAMSDIKPTAYHLRFVTGGEPTDPDERRRYHRDRENFNPSDEHREIAEKTIELVRSSQQRNEYINKLQQVVEQGHVSDKNRNLFASAITVWMRAEREKENAKRKAHIPALEAGKQTITGKIVKREVRICDYTNDEVTKVTIEDESGRRVWGTLARFIEEAQKGDTVTFTATVKVSDRDATFGFYSRPHGEMEILKKEGES